MVTRSQGASNSRQSKGRYQHHEDEQEHHVGADPSPCPRAQNIGLAQPEGTSCLPHVRRFALALLSLLASGCLTARAREARDLMEAGHPASALALWERILQQNQKDEEAKAGRIAALDALAQGTCLRAHAGALEALVELEQFVSQGAHPPSCRERARSACGQAARRRVEAPLGLGQPLEARQILATLPLEAAGLESVARELEAEIGRVGARRCAVLSSLAQSPHLATFVARYCGAFGAAGPRVTLLPEARSSLSLEVQMVGASPEGLSAQLTEAFRASPWFDAHSPGALELKVAGHLESHVDSTPLTVTSRWIEQEMYTTTEQQTESYQESYTEMETHTETTTEPYTATEMRSVSVPTTTYESYSYTCGSYPHTQTCYGTRPVTQYRSELRSETVTRYRSGTRQVSQLVTKFRPATRTVSKSVTHYRPVPRSVEYKAVRWHAVHHGQVVMLFGLPGTSEPLSVPWSSAVDQSDVEHEMNLPAAQLTPHRAQVPSEADWHQQLVAGMNGEAQRTLSEAWRKAFCEELGTPEQAARCARLKGSGPKPWAVLATFFGESEAALRTVLE